MIGIKKRRTYSEYLNNPVHMVWVVISLIDYVINKIYGLCCWDGGLVGWGVDSILISCSYIFVDVLYTAMQFQ